MTHRNFPIRSKGENTMTMLIKTLAAVAAATVLATNALAQSPSAGPSPFVPVEDEPAPKLIVKPPLPDHLSRGAALIPYRTENFRIVPVFGAGAPAPYLHGSGICT